jgi:hypothetical protein
MFAFVPRPEVTPMRLRRRIEYPPEPSPGRELAYRISDGIHVRLLWHPDTDAVSISVDDSKTGERFERPVPGTEALFAFNHPFVYAQ